MATWPAQFCPLLNSLQESPPENAIRSSMDKGPAKIRRRTTANIRPLSFRLFLKPAQLEIMENFYEVETYSGVDEFDYIHPRTSQAVKARFVSLSWNERSGVGYDVSVSLEILP